MNRISVWPGDMELQLISGLEAEHAVSTLRRRADTARYSARRAMNVLAPLFGSFQRLHGGTMPTALVKRVLDGRPVLEFAQPRDHNFPLFSTVSAHLSAAIHFAGAHKAHVTAWRTLEVKWRVVEYSMKTLRTAESSRSAAAFFAQHGCELVAETFKLACTLACVDHTKLKAKTTRWFLSRSDPANVVWSLFRDQYRATYPADIEELLNECQLSTRHVGFTVSVSHGTVTVERPVIRL